MRTRTHTRAGTRTLFAAVTVSVLGTTVLTGCQAKDDKADGSGPATAATAPPVDPGATAAVTRPADVPTGKAQSTAPSTSGPSGR
ncbi:hypothetical protein ABZS54_30460, partial [Embleya sp. NPDC005575]